MGSSDFYQLSTGKSPKEAFQSARQQAQYEYGHAGYTGTIAEKDSFVLIEAPAGVDAHVYAETLMLNDDARINDKWGPAGCIKAGENEYLFFGWASD